MELQAWKPLQELASLKERIEKLSSGLLWSPAADWFETDDSLILVLDAPGIEAESLEIAHDEQQLTVAGTREAQRYGQSRQSERPQGQFQRQLLFPEPVEPGSAVAQYRAGQLEVRFAKLGRTITVG